MVPTHLRDQIGQARIVVTNFHGFLHREKVSIPKATRELLGTDIRGAFTETPRSDGPQSMSKPWDEEEHRRLERRSPSLLPAQTR